MTKDPLIFTGHITESIKHIETFTKGMTRAEFMRDVQVQDAVIRRLEIIGEATKNIPAGFRRKYPDIRWEAMARMRDKLIHHYFGVDLKITWNVVEKELPVLKKQLAAISNGEKGR